MISGTEYFHDTSRGTPISYGKLGDCDEPMIKKVSKADLKLGMFIHDLNCGWMDHSFLRNSFMLRKESDLQKIMESGISEVYIDTIKGIDSAASPHPGGGAGGPHRQDPGQPGPSAPARRPDHATRRNWASPSRSRRKPTR